MNLRIKIIVVAFVLCAAAGCGVSPGPAKGPAKQHVPAAVPGQSQRVIKQVIPDVWRVGGTSWGSKDFATLSLKGDSNVYLVRLKNGLVLVDCATIKSMPIIEENIRLAGFEANQVSDLMLSHSHADHTEAASLWRKRYGLRTHLSEIGAIFMDRDDSSLLGYVGGDYPLKYAPFVVDHRVRDGEVFQVAGTTVTATYVPGHTLDSTLFTLELNGQIIGISGDFVFGPADWNKAGGGLGAMRTLWKASLRDYRDSLKRVLEMEIDVLLPGHGRIIAGRENVRKELTTALATIENLLATEKIYIFGMHKPQLKRWMKANGLEH